MRGCARKTHSLAFRIAPSYFRINPNAKLTRHVYARRAIWAALYAIRRIWGAYPIYTRDVPIRSIFPNLHTSRISASYSAF